MLYYLAPTYRVSTSSSLQAHFAITLPLCYLVMIVINWINHHSHACSFSLQHPWKATSPPSTCCCMITGNCCCCRCQNYCFSLCSLWILHIWWNLHLDFFWCLDVLLRPQMFSSEPRHTVYSRHDGLIKMVNLSVIALNSTWALQGGGSNKMQFCLVLFSISSTFMTWRHEVEHEGSGTRPPLFQMRRINTMNKTWHLDIDTKVFISISTNKM